MNSKLVFMRRTPKEVEVFGGEVYIDIDGRNIGLLSTTDFEYEISSGVRKIKMYKSHSFGSFIGHAEIELDIKEREQLLLKYAPPMLLNQPGSIIVSDYKSKAETESIAREQEYIINRDLDLEEEKKRELDEKTKNGVIIFIIFVILSTIFYAISISDIY